MRREKTLISKIRTAKGVMTTNITEIPKSSDYFESQYCNKFENFEEMDRFLDTYHHPKMNQEDINHLHRSITQNKIEAAIKSLSKKKSPGPHGFTAEFYQTFKEELIPTLLKLFHEVEREGTLPNSFYEAKITLIPKPDKDPSKKENYRPISLMNIDAKFLNKIWQTKSNNTSERSYTMTKLASSQECRVVSTYENHKRNKPHQQKQRQKPHDHLNRCRKKTFDKIQHHFMIKALRKLGIEGKYLNIIKPIYANLQPTSY
jgi:hypothetical protein